MITLLLLLLCSFFEDGASSDTTEEFSEDISAFEVVSSTDEEDTVPSSHPHKAKIKIDRINAVKL